MQRLLIISDSENVEAPAQEMKDAGYAVERCCFAEALGRLRAADPGALVLDLSRPTNLTDLRRLLSEHNVSRETPTLALLRAEHLTERLAHLQVDDFAVIPLRPRELEARMRHMLKRRRGIDSPDVLRQGALVLDLANYRVFVGGSPVEFTFREHQLLGFLATNADRVFSREALLDQVWGCDYLGGTRTVDVHIRRIRSKIERGGHSFIETVRSVGYRFHASPTA
jgi:DNA-binding response OmpR family regulator